MKCPNCGSERIVYDYHTGEVKCSECGYVIEEIIDTAQEWRAYTEEQRLARARAEPVKAHAQMATLIGWASGLSAERRSEFARLSRVQILAASDEKSIKAGVREIARITAALQLPNQVREEAQRLFVVAQRAGLLRSGGVAAMAAACIMLACREYGLPDPGPRLFEVSPADRQRVRRCYVELAMLVSGRVRLKPPSPLKYVPMIVSKLGLSPEIQQLAAKIIRAAEAGRVLLGKPPRSIAAASVYLAALICGERGRRRYEIAEAAGITETTLRKRAKELLRRLDIVVQI